MRSFIAVEMPEALKSSLAEIQQELKKSGADIRWVRPENIHLTLMFLGEITEQTAEAVIQVLEGTCSHHEPFTVEVGGIGVFPGIRSPRVLWAGLDSEAVMTLQQEVVQGAHALGFEEENRTFHPHLTLGRFRSARGKRQLLERIRGMKEVLPGPVDVKSVALLKSELRPGGAHYTVIADVPLAGGGEPQG